MPRILIIEDQRKLRRNLQEFLQREGFEVASSDNGEEGFQLAASRSFDAVILDLTLPRRDGLDVLQDLRAQRVETPILILTARDSIEERVCGLDQGADDYVVKPFSHAELVARVRALLRRKGPSAQHVLECGDVEAHLLTRSVLRRGQPIELSQREFELLEYLLRQKNTDVTREALARDVWKEPGGVLTNAIDVCVNGLRKKLDVPGSRPFIVTVRGVGYTVRDSE